MLRLTAVLLSLLFSSAFAAEKPTSPAYSSAVSVTTLLKTQTDGTGKKLSYPAGTPEVTAVLVEIAPGQQTNWHVHPVPCFAYMLEGEISVELANGEKKTFKAGDAMAEAVNMLHNGTNPGRTPARLVMFIAGTAGQPFAVKDSTPR